MRLCGQQQSPCIAVSLPVCEMGKEQPVPPSSSLSLSESPAPLSEGRILPIHNRRKEIQVFPGGGSEQRKLTWEAVFHGAPVNAWPDYMWR